jgi:hypothetical protein
MVNVVGVILGGLLVGLTHRLGDYAVHVGVADLAIVLPAFAAVCVRQIHYRCEDIAPHVHHRYIEITGVEIVLRRVGLGDPDADLGQIVTDLYQLVGTLPRGSVSGRSV